MNLAQEDIPKCQVFIFSLMIVIMAVNLLSLEDQNRIYFPCQFFFVKVTSNHNIHSMIEAHECFL